MDPDIFGIAFNDYMLGNYDEVVTVDCSVAEVSYLPVAYFFRDFNIMPEGEQSVMEACKGRVLDVGAGAGSHALYMQKKGLDVTAIDISEGAVEVMKKRGVRKAFCVDFFKLKEKRFDNILFLMNGAGVGQTIEGFSKLLKHVKRLIAKDGSVYIESSDIMYMFEEDDGSCRIDLGSDYYGEVKYILKYKEFTGKEFEWLFIDRDNMEHIAEKVGFKTSMFYESGQSNYIMKLSLA